MVGSYVGSRDSNVLTQLNQASSPAHAESFNKASINIYVDKNTIGKFTKALVK